ncbi:MAG: hypothetical protein JO283_19050 [Bradyrhizobium sp.]|nr:hypothetical protein [Bradyrhizobium sp.]
MTWGRDTSTAACRYVAGFTLQRRCILTSKLYGPTLCGKKYSDRPADVEVPETSRILLAY